MDIEEQVLLSEEQVLTFIPHRNPIVMVDKLLKAASNHFVTTYTVKEGGIFTKDGKLMEGGLVENLAQTAAVGIAFIKKKESEEPAIGFLCEVKGLEIFDFPNLGDEVRTEVEVTNELFNFIVMEGKIWHKGILLATSKMKLMVEKTPERV